MGDPALDETRLQPPLTPELQARIPARLLRLSVPGETLLEALPRLQEVYTGTIAYEIEHISDHAERVWLRQAIESGRFRRPLAPAERRALLERLAQVEAFETYLRRAFIGQKQFSIEGLDVLVPMLDEAIELAARGGAHEVLDRDRAPRPAQRPRAHGRPARTRRSCASSRASARIDALVVRSRGRHGRREVPPRRVGVPQDAAGEIQVTLAANPSHLEAVDPVVEGLARAEQTDRSRGAGIHDPTVALADPHPRRRFVRGAGRRRGDVQPALARRLLDGRDAARHRQQPGRLHDRSGGGALDAVLERPREGLRRSDHPRERRRSRGGARRRSGSRSPTARSSATTSSSTSSATGDSATTSRTRPRTRSRSRPSASSSSPPSASRTRRRLVAEGVHRRGRGRVACSSRTLEELRGCTRRAADVASPTPMPPPEPTHEDRHRRRGRHGRPGRPPARARRAAPARCPTASSVNPKLARQLERRREALARGRDRLGPRRGARVRVAPRGGDPDPALGPGHRARHVLPPPRGAPRPARPARRTRRSSTCRRPPRRSRSTTRRSRSTRRSPSSTATRSPRPTRSCSGRRSSATSSTARRSSSTSSSSRAARSGVRRHGSTLLLPHGYEGNGPEHSSARLERFLQLAAQDNIRVVNCTTAAQFFHLLRRQALDATARPLVVMTPKGLLRLRQATSTLDELALGSFQPVLDDPDADHARPAARPLQREGLLRHRRARGSAAAPDGRGRPDRAPVPVPARRGRRRSSRSYPELREIVWAQEEPQNMGAWRSIRHRLEEAAAHAPQASGVQYVGRPWRASPSEGYPTLHQCEQDRIVREALGVGPASARRAAAARQRRRDARTVRGGPRAGAAPRRQPAPCLEHGARRSAARARRR